jgi:hypothetical protein
MFAGVEIAIPPAVLPSPSWPMLPIRVKHQGEVSD